MDLNEIRKAGRLEKSLETLFEFVKDVDKDELQDVALALRTNFRNYSLIMGKYELQDKKFREIRRGYILAIQYIHQNL